MVPASSSWTDQRSARLAARSALSASYTPLRGAAKPRTRHTPPQNDVVHESRFRRRRTHPAVGSPCSLPPCRRRWGRLGGASSRRLLVLQHRKCLRPPSSTVSQQCLNGLAKPHPHCSCQDKHRNPQWSNKRVEDQARARRRISFPRLLAKLLRPSVSRMNRQCWIERPGGGFGRSQCPNRCSH